MRSKLLEAVRRRPWRTAGLLSFLLVSAAAGLYAYAVHQWHAAQVALREGQITEAQSRLKLCLLVWPRSVPVQLLAARAERMSGQFTEAEARLHHCLKLQHGKNADIELEFLLLRVQNGEVDAVEPILWQCVQEHHPETPLILETLAQAFLHNLRYGPALVCLERWIQEAPDRARPLYWRGWIYERLGIRPEAIKDYRRAVELDGEFAPARLRLVELCLQISNVAEALPHLQHLAQQFPDRPDIQARLGHCRFLQGRTEEARGLLESAAEKLPDDLLLLIQLGRLENEHGQPSKAEKWLRRALEIDPTDAEAQHLLANSLAAQNRSEEAETLQEQLRQNTERLNRINHLLREATQHPLTDPDALYEIGQLFLEGKQEHIGLYWLHQALEIDPSHQAALRTLADHYDKKGQATTAAMYRQKLKPAKATPARAASQTRP
jgi:tetratricopeptide (TPR) repeat protein